MAAPTITKPHSDSRRLQVVAGTRLTREEMARLRAKANTSGLSVSNYLRTLLPEEIVTAR